MYLFTNPWCLILSSILWPPPHLFYSSPKRIIKQKPKKIPIYQNKILGGGKPIQSVMKNKLANSRNELETIKSVWVTLIISGIMLTLLTAKLRKRKKQYAILHHHLEFVNWVLRASLQMKVQSLIKITKTSQLNLKEAKWDYKFDQDV